MKKIKMALLPLAFIAICAACNTTANDHDTMANTDSTGIADPTSMPAATGLGQSGISTTNMDPNDGGATANGGTGGVESNGDMGGRNGGTLDSSRTLNTTGTRASNGNVGNNGNRNNPGSATNNNNPNGGGR